jgi:hypothetical protein
VKWIQFAQSRGCCGRGEPSASVSMELVRMGVRFVTFLTFIQDGAE